MTPNQILKELEALGDEKVRKHNTKSGAGKNQFGVKLGDIRKLAKKIKVNHELALELWKTKNIDARFLAILLLKPKELTSKQMERLVRSVKFVRVADWLNSYVLKHHPDKESLRQQWMEADHVMVERMGWALTHERIAKSPEGIDMKALLDRIEAEMGDAHEHVQWTMNFCLVEIGIRNPKLRKRALAIGEELGLYRDYPEVKGCTSPYAPIWINEMVSRQG